MCTFEQPERLLDLLRADLASFYQAAQSDMDASVITKRFDAVITDASRLFVLKEEVMRSSHAPDAEAHRQRHAALLNLARHIRTNLELDVKEAALPAMLFTEQWLEQHLRGLDQPYLAVNA